MRRRAERKPDQCSAIEWKIPEEHFSNPKRTLPSSNTKFNWANLFCHILCLLIGTNGKGTKISETILLPNSRDPKGIGSCRILLLLPGMKFEYSSRYDGEEEDIESSLVLSCVNGLRFPHFSPSNWNRIKESYSFFLDPEFCVCVWWLGETL